MNYLKIIGDETEFQAKPILEQEFEIVEWISKDNPNSPFDFLCIDKGTKFKIDVKSCLNRDIIISRKKFERLKQKIYGNFYFLLFGGEGFHLITFEEALQSEMYSFRFRESYKRKSKPNKPRGRPPSVILNESMLKLINVDDEKWKTFRKFCVNHDTTMKAEFNKFLDGGPELWNKNLLDNRPIGENV